MGTKKPTDINSALEKLTCAVENERKELFLGILGLSGKCDATLPCGSIRIPNTEIEWAKECFSAKCLDFRRGVEAWLSGTKYDARTGSSPWLNHLDGVWNLLSVRKLKHISKKDKTKDTEWLFCVAETRTGRPWLNPEAIRLANSQMEYENMKRLGDVCKTESGIFFISWGVLPYNGFMKSKDGALYYHVKRKSWWNSNNPECYTRDSDGSFKLADAKESIVKL